ncbi:DUF4113 domain-containing protein [Halomonas sp.]|uniref:DUF4113 domain-containing protein n=1 Tax=Halomonas sp. TaxID=1486246 RepID=UPI003F9127CC
MATIDANEKMGKGTVRLGLPEKNAPWHLRCASRNPRYTTNWDELMVAYTDEGAARIGSATFSKLSIKPSDHK